MNYRNKSSTSLYNLKNDYILNINRIFKIKNKSFNSYDEILRNKNKKKDIKNWFTKKRKKYKNTNVIRTLQIYIEDRKVVKFMNKIYIKLLNENIRNCNLIIKIINYNPNMIKMYINNTGISVNNTNYTSMFIIDNNKLNEILSFKKTQICIYWKSRIPNNKIEFYSYFSKDNLKNNNDIFYMRTKYFGNWDNLKKALKKRKISLPKNNIINIQKDFKYSNPKTYNRNLESVKQNKLMFLTTKFQKNSFIILKKNYKNFSKKSKFNFFLKKRRNLNILKNFFISVKIIGFFKSILQLYSINKTIYILNNKIFCLKYIFISYKMKIKIKSFNNRLLLNNLHTFKLLYSKKNYNILIILENFKNKFILKNNLIRLIKKKPLKLIFRKSMRTLNLYRNIYKYLFSNVYKENFKKYKNTNQININKENLTYNYMLYHFIYLKLKNNEYLKELSWIKVDLNMFIVNYLEIF